MFFHPGIFLLVEFLLLLLVIAFTSPKAILRSAVVPPLVACAAKVVLDAPTRMRGCYAVFCCGTIINSLMLYIESALIVRWSFETQSLTTVAKPQISTGKRDSYSDGAITTQTHGGTFWERFRYGYFVLTSNRSIGTPYMVKGVPNFSHEDRHYIPSRRAFLFRKAALVIIAQLSIELGSMAIQPVEYNEVAFAPEAVPLIRGNKENRSVEKLVFRSMTVLGFWFSMYLSLNGVLSCLNFLAVALGMDDVRTNRPNFGAISEAYSVRQLWRSVPHSYPF